MTLTDGGPYAQLSIEALLEKLIGVRQTHQLYRGSLQPLFSHPTQGQHQNEICAVARELVARWLDEEIRRDCNLSAPSNVRDYLRIFFAGQEHESFVLLLLDAQNRLIVGKELFRGTLTQTSVYPREVVKEALASNAGAVIFAHNHPSGCSEPSRADEMLTSNLKSALALVDVKVIDHFVIAGSTCLSFAERGLL